MKRKKFHLSEIHHGLNYTTEVRPDFNIMLKCSSFLEFCFELGEPETVDSTQAVEWFVAVGTNYHTEVCGVQLYESANNVVVQSTSVTFRNFYHSWVSVLMDQSHFDISSIIIFIQTVRNPQLCMRRY